MPNVVVGMGLPDIPNPPKKKSTEVKPKVKNAVLKEIEGLSITLLYVRFLINLYLFQYSKLACRAFSGWYYILIFLTKLI